MRKVCEWQDGDGERPMCDTGKKGGHAMNELIRQTRELCNTAETNYYIDVVVPELCDALEAAQKENEELKNILRFNMVQIHGERTTVLDELSSLAARAEKAEAERDTYRAALQLLELMISGEREGSKEREHSVGVVIAVNRARELMKGELGWRD